MEERNETYSRVREKSQADTLAGVAAIALTSPPPRVRVAAHFPCTFPSAFRGDNLSAQILASDRCSWCSFVISTALQALNSP